MTPAIRKGSTGNQELVKATKTLSQAEMAECVAGVTLKIFLLLFTGLLGNCFAKLNVFLDAREVSRFLYGK